MKLTKKDIISIISNWNIGELKYYKLLYSHWNLSYKIVTPKGKFILKSLTMQKKEILKKELKILSLLKNKIPTRSLIKSKSGKDYLIIKSYPVLILEFIEGIILKDGSKASLNVLKQLGRYLALIHSTNYKIGSTINVSKQINEMMEKIDKNSLEYGSLKKCMSIIKMRGFDKKKFPKGLVHMDIHTENMIIKNDKIVAIIDFEDANRNYFIYDIGLIIFDTCFIKNKILSEKRINAFIESYEKIRSLEDIEREHIYDAMLVNWMRILYYTLVKNGMKIDSLKTGFMKDYFKRINSIIPQMEKRL